ncbi:MAG: phytoene desaturase [Proteobacteria bacterium]|nr:phytoene desaturase [Pseudomonadota bacterium]
MPAPRVAVIGAGMAGLSAALTLAARGARVVVLERAQAVGGKLRQTRIEDALIDAGPTVFTMRPVFEELLRCAGHSLEERLPLVRADVLARHAWSESERLDLYADRARTADAIGTFAGAREAQGYLRFARDAQRVFRAMEVAYLRDARPGPLRLVRRMGARALPALWYLRPFESLWRALARYFRDARLQQLFGRYATYCGSSPFQAPATLMLVAHVEQEGVWVVPGGMQRVAQTVADLAQECGAELRLGSDVQRILLRAGRVNGVSLATGEFVPADAVILNADVAALADGSFGAELAHAVPRPRAGGRSLSAITWAVLGHAEGFPLSRHNVFFSPDYAAEFAQLFGARQVPAWPTVYVCAQDRDAGPGTAPDAAERLLCLINAPADGDDRSYSPTELEQCERRTFSFLERCGLKVRRSPSQTLITTPRQFETLYPATGGSLYGSATHGWRGAFSRPGARTRVPGLYLAGGSVHPGPGLPMTVLSGSLAATCLLKDAASSRRRRGRDTRGGTSMP